MISLSKKDVLKQLKLIFRRSVKNQKWHIALQATILQAKHLGLFTKQPLPPVKKFADMTKEELTDFTDALTVINPHFEEEEILYRKFKEQKKLNDLKYHPPDDG